MCGSTVLPAKPCKGRYPARTLAGWAGALAGWTRGGRDVYCCFDNDEAGYAAQDAERLQDLVGR